MPRPKRGYGTTQDGQKIIGVTTVVSYFGNPGGLINWAWDLGIRGIDYRKARDDAMNVGTIAHAMIDAHLQGKKEPKFPDTPPDILDKAETAVLSFLKWRDMVDFQILETESTLYDYDLALAGTPDLAAIKGENLIVDWKASKKIYPETVGQIAAYRHLWNKNYPDKLIRSGGILQLDKDSANFTFHYYEGKYLDICWEFYLHIFKALRIYREKMGGK